MTTEPVEMAPVVYDWYKWGTIDDDGQYVTFGEQAQRRKIDAARTIADQLGESLPGPRRLINDCVRQIGTTLCLETLQETLEIEQNGGMMLPDEGRRRTPGGVFFKLIKTKYPEARKICAKYSHTPKKAKVKGPAQTPKKQKEPKVRSRKPVDEKKEKGIIVKITLIGRPSSRVVDQSTFVVMIFQVNKVPALPKGLPEPAETKTNYIISIASKQWKQVAEALDDPEDSFIIEGFPQIDKNGSIAVYTTSITTKKLQAAKRTKQEQSAL